MSSTKTFFRIILILLIFFTSNVLADVTNNLNPSSTTGPYQVTSFNWEFPLLILGIIFILGGLFLFFKKNNKMWGAFLIILGILLILALMLKIIPNS